MTQDATKQKSFARYAEEARQKEQERDARRKHDRRMSHARKLLYDSRQAGQSSDAIYASMFDRNDGTRDEEITAYRWHLRSRALFVRFMWACRKLPDSDVAALLNEPQPSAWPLYRSPGDEKY